MSAFVQRLLSGLLVLVALPVATFGQERFFESSGLSIRYDDQGQGEPVVLVHGLGGSLDSWFGLGIAQDLSRDYRVIALDLRAHGKSGKPHDPKAYGREMGLDIVRLLDHLAIRRAPVVGHSLGAFLTSQLLTLHPERFVSATLGAGACFLRWGPRTGG